MEENKKRLMETINRNFEEGGELLVRVDYKDEEKAKNEELDKLVNAEAAAQPA